MTDVISTTDTTDTMPACGIASCTSCERIPVTTTTVTVDPDLTVDTTHDACEMTQARLTRELEAARRLASAGEARLARIVESAHEWAEEYGLCSRFDDFCEEHGLPTRVREQDYNVTVTVDLTLTIPVTAESEDDACERIGDSDVREAITAWWSDYRYGYSVPDYEVGDAELA